MFQRFEKTDKKKTMFIFSVNSALCVSYLSNLCMSEVFKRKSFEKFESQCPVHVYVEEAVGQGQLI